MPSNPYAWFCLQCDAIGTTNAGAERHGNDQQHATVTGLEVSE